MTRVSSIIRTPRAAVLAVPVLALTFGLLAEGAAAQVDAGCAKAVKKAFSVKNKAARNQAIQTICRTADAGPQGPPGASGAPGAAGLNGAAGATGATGATGPTTGATGATGATGPTGPSGVTGPTGSTGSTGGTGSTGATGSTVLSAVVRIGSGTIDGGNVDKSCNAGETATGASATTAAVGEGLNLTPLTGGVPTVDGGTPDGWRATNSNQGSGDLVTLYVVCAA
jgi:hypothetical protein